MKKSIKEIMVFDFKKEFIIKDKLDVYIEKFIIEINKSLHINTLYSCEGHGSNDSSNGGITPYLLFNVDEVGWNIFWLNILPEISLKINIGVKIFNNNTNKSIVIYCLYGNKGKFWKNVFLIFKKYFLDI